jgi:recombination protein RecA
MADKKTKDTPAPSGKGQALDLALSQIEKQFGKGSIMRLGEAHAVNVETIPTGSISLDLALGGGIPKGRIIEIYGPESSGKTTVCLHAVAEVQKAGGTAAYIDAEHALDPAYAKRLGVDTDQLLISQPDSGEQALEILETLVRSNAVDIVVIDSVAALVPQATTGGNALKFYASVRMDIRRTSQIKQGDSIIGNHVRVKVVKNKVAPPFREAEFDIMYNQGISREGDVIDLAVQQGVVDKAGAWYEYNGEKIAQGREAAKNFLAQNPTVFDEIAQKTVEAAKA